MPAKTVLFKIRRQANPSAAPHWEEFALPWHSGMNVISSLMEIARNPVTRDGKPTTPITYDSNCCCMEACPQFNEGTGFVGAATISQVRLFNTHPTGAALKRERLAALMGDGGIQECGYAQNCVEVCPKDIPLTRSIAEVGGDVMKQAIGDLFRK